MRPRWAWRFHHELMLKYLPGSAFSRVKQRRVAEERREHPLNPAGLGRAVVLIFCLLALRPTWASHSTSIGPVTCLLTSNKLTLVWALKAQINVVWAWAWKGRSRPHMQPLTFTGLVVIIQSIFSNYVLRFDLLCGEQRQVQSAGSGLKQHCVYIRLTACRWLITECLRYCNMWLSNHSLSGWRCCFNECIFVWMFKGHPKHVFNPK